MTPDFIRRAEELEQLALQHIGSPYLWPCEENGWRVGKGQQLPDGRRSFDCSGFVVWHLLQAAPKALIDGKPIDIRYTPARTLCLKLAPAEGPGLGRVACYGPTPDRCDHVMLCLQDGRVLGASGGGRRTITLEDAARQNARVKMKPSPLYGPRLLGYRWLPLG